MDMCTINSTWTGRRKDRKDTMIVQLTSHDKPALELYDTVRFKKDTTTNDWVRGRVVESLPFRSYKVEAENG